MDRIYTGFESLDKHLKLYKGDLVVIGGGLLLALYVRFGLDLLHQQFPYR